MYVDYSGVEVYSKESSRWMKAKVNDQFVEGDRIRTGIHSNVEVIFASAPSTGRFRLKQKSQLRLTILDYKKEQKVLMDLAIGGMIVATNKDLDLSSGVSIRTPTATVDANQSLFEVNVDRQV